MDIAPLTCLSCGAPLQVPRDAASVTCRYCGHPFAVSFKAPPRSAATFDARAVRVGPDGDFTTLREALSAAEDGARILVARGTYEERLVILREVHLVAADGPGTVTLRPSRAEIERVRARMDEDLSAREEASAAQDAHRKKLWSFGKKFRDEQERLDAAYDRAYRAVSDHHWSLEAPLLRIESAFTLEGMKLESRNWDGENVPSSAVEVTARASSVRFVDVELSQHVRHPMTGIDVHSDVCAEFERCKVSGFSAEKTAAIQFVDVLFDEGRGSLDCVGCTLEKNFVGLEVGGLGVHRVRKCMFRMNHCGIVRRLPKDGDDGDVVLQAEDNTFESNKVDQGVYRASR